VIVMRIRYTCRRRLQFTHICVRLRTILAQYSCDKLSFVVRSSYS